MTVLFDPNVDDDQAQDTLRKVVELARSHVDLDKYEVLELNLLNFVPEQKTRERSMTVELPATFKPSSSVSDTGP